MRHPVASVGCETRQVPGGSITTGDCLDVLPTLRAGRYNLVLTDPPYAMPATFYGGRQTGSRRWSDTSIMHGWFSLVATQLDRVLTPDGTVAIFCDTISSAVFTSVLYARFPTLKHMVWDKRSTGLGRSPRSSHELILVGQRQCAWVRDNSIPTVLRAPRVPPARKRHLAQKPVPVLVELIKFFCPPTGRVLDPFAGSGSTLDAARSTGRECDLIELDAADTAPSAQLDFEEYVTAS
ncbi:DNA-methyltransferase [Candidatus Palauibacter sp.]|uniref:DNA-methyltransferase n=1 Tax=Candidatus Palauibacter sp. TaxID=3101350 RepID=UPI003CC56572